MSNRSTIPIVIISLASLLLCGFLLLGDGSDLTETQPAPQPVSFNSHKGYTGTESCIGCHQQQYQDWMGSHHDQAMQHASEATVKGDFNNSRFDSEGNSALFFKKEDGFYARLAGINNQVDDYKILYTFGTEPLQQYLVAFPNGRLQQLPVAWDTEQKKWFDPQPELKAVAGEWVHWTEGGKNWNSMCSDCHSTNVEKNFNRLENSYSTSIAEINVACESCHGPGEKHIETVEAATFKPGTDNPHIDMMSAENPQVLVEKCARCHSRRQQLTAKFEHGSSELLDHYLPSVLTAPLYHGDGQIYDEVFVYGSFVQSKMYHSNIGCIDCHQPHSTALKAEGNQLCVTCHSSAEFDTPKHHHHAQQSSIEKQLAENLSSGTKSAGNQCVDCHMPGRIYMGNDFRRDHSFRIPRPDLSVAHGTPNACNDCHTEQSADWASAAVENWFGNERPAHFSETLASAANDPSASVNPLTALLNDRFQPVIARATAASILAPAISVPSVEKAITAATADHSALVRTYATRALGESSNGGDSNGGYSNLEPLLLLLNDRVRAVRIAAAQALAAVPKEHIPASYQAALAAANREYQTSMEINTDFASGRYQLAVDKHRRGNLVAAAQLYLESLKIDHHFNAARLNLAQIYYAQGKIQQTEELYRTIISQEPNASEAHYSLGLLMAEQGDFKQAVTALTNAAATGNNPRAWYTLAILYQQRGMGSKSEESYLKALQEAPGDPEFTNGLVSLYGQQQRWPKALLAVEKALATNPQHSALAQLKQVIKESMPPAK
ncbi:MAG: tetratricopeptide repeat protein [Porticoccaceae bacterium]|nr:tetratricopeptide repeat protein [Porticoccaceae bacterium]